MNRARLQVVASTPASRPVEPFAAALLGGLLDAAWLVDAESRRIVAANAAAAQLLGLELEQLRGQAVESLSSTPEDLLFWLEAAADPAASLCSDTLMRHADGRMLWVTRKISPVDGFWLVTLRDLTEQRRAEEERETLLAELRATLESTADGILVTDLAGRMRSFNQRFASMWGLPQDLLSERNEQNDQAVQLWMRRSVVDGPAYAHTLAALQDSPLMQSSEQIRLLDGRILERVSLPQFSRGRPVGRVFSFRDLSEKLAASQRIEALSLSDLLTGLPNRRALVARLDSPRRPAALALLHVGLDRFKQINDTLGHGYGDRVLREVAERLREGLRTGLREEDLVARLGGDEFLLMIEGADARAAENAALRVQRAMSRPFSFDTLSFTVTCSIGVALFPGDGDGAEALLASAERAMHWVKESGRSAYRFHQPRKDVDLLSRMRLDHAMREALAQGRFRLHYQPQIALASNEVVGAEALIRWRDPLRGEVSPNEFIPVAEESGFIAAIGEWVLREAVEQAAAWWREGRRMPVAVNVSALQFQQAGFVDFVASVLREAGLPPELLELELTESILVRDADEAMRRLEALAALGVCMSIDDFGTGYSSLGYLKRFPIQRLKIDRSFVRGLPEDGSDAGIVDAVIQMGRALRLSVIAEGVECEAQRDFLRRAGCDEFQGYLYAPALEARAFETRVWGATRH